MACKGVATVRRNDNDSNSTIPPGFWVLVGTVMGAACWVVLFLLGIGWL